MSCIFSDVSGHFVKSVSTADEQVLSHPDSVVWEQGGPATTPQESACRDATNPVTEPPVNVLSVLETQSDRLNFPNLHGAAEEDEDKEDEDKEDEEEEEQDDEDDKEDEDKEDEEEEE